MSLILEALRKSEQQRRLGETPGLVSESAWAVRRWHGAPRARRPTWMFWLPLTVVAAAGAWWLWRGSTHDHDRMAVTDTSRVTPPGAESVASTAPTPEPLSAPPQPQAVPEAPASAAAATPIEPQPLPAGPDDVASPTEGLDGLTAARIERGELVTNNPQLLRPQPPTPAPQYVPPEAALPQPLPETPELSSTAPAADTAMIAPPMPPETVDLAAPLPAPPAQVATPAPAPEAERVSGEVLAPIYALPLAVRQTLPKLLLTMHVWNADPSKRFVILNDERAVEGGSAGEGLSVLEIRRDGVALDFRGTRFLLPRSGY